MHAWKVDESMCGGIKHEEILSRPTLACAMSPHFDVPACRPKQTGSVHFLHIFQSLNLSWKTEATS